MAHAQVGMAIVSATLVVVGSGLSYKGLKNKSRAEVIHLIDHQPKISEDQRVLLKGLVVASEARTDRAERAQVKAYFDDVASRLAIRENELKALPADRAAPYLTRLADVQKSQLEVIELGNLIDQRDVEVGTVAAHAAIAIKNLPPASAPVAITVKPAEQAIVEAKVESARWWSEKGPIFGLFFAILGALTALLTLVKKVRKTFGPAPAVAPK